MQRFFSNTTRRRVFWACATLVLGVFALQLPAQSQSQRISQLRTVVIDGHEAVAGEVLGGFKRALSSSEHAQFVRQLDADDVEDLGPTIRRLHSRSYNIEALRSFLNAQSVVSYAEPNYIIHAVATTPNDPGFPSLWGLLNTGQTVNGGGPTLKLESSGGGVHVKKL